MKILGILFKNIHSLKGEHRLDFTVPPLSQSGLFAITGPTGAGKSTILDVITLALFSRIPRFDSKITNTEIEKIGSVMTQYTDDSYAEVEYQSNGKIYRSTWRISKTRTGNLKPYEMSIATLPDGKYMDLKNSDVPAANERIIGLNYEQFIRSILLSQGEFARFLRSDDKERAKLLEDITGSHIYRLLGKAAFDKAKSIKDEISTIKLKISAIPSLTVQDIKEKKETIQSNKKKLTYINTVLNEKNHVLHLAEKRKQIRIKLDQLMQEQTSIEAQKSAFRVQEQKLEKHQALDVFRTDITLHLSEEKRLLEHHAELSGIDQKIKIHQHLLQDISKKMSSFVGKQLDDSNYMQEIRKFEQHIFNLDKTLENLKDSGAKWRIKLTSALNNSNNKHAEIIKNMKNISDQLAYTVNECLVLTSITTTYTEDQIKFNINKLQEKLVILQQKYNDAVMKEAALYELNKIGKDIEKYTDLKKENFNNWQVYSDEIVILEMDLHQLNKKKEVQLQISSLDEHRKNLKEGEPCALCGSKHHPYLHDKNLIQIGEIELEIFNKTKAFKDKQSLQMITQNAISIAESKIEMLTESVKIKTSIISEMEKKWNTEEISLFKSEVIANEIEKNKTELISFSEAGETLHSLKFLTEIKDILTELNTIANQYVDIVKTRNNLYKGNNINFDTEQLLEEYLKEREKDNSLKLLSTTIHNNISTLDKSLLERNAILKPKLLLLGYKNITEASADIMAEGQLNSILSKKQTLNQQAIENKTSINNLEKELEESGKQDDTEINMEEISLQINVLNKEKENLLHQNGALENELTTDQENKKITSAMQNILNEKEGDAGKWYILEKLIGDATGSKYAKYAQNLSLKYLIKLANKRLTKLSDRYILAYSDIESDLTIMDLYQGSITRSVKTLSGGESFIVSLALALSLADMASKNVKLESLFIDEGFGTLDAETLETALETLEKLQSESSRTIGVISHVDSLKERITTQVRLSKNNIGHSTIEVVS